MSCTDWLWLAFYYDHKPKVGSQLFCCCCGLTAFLFWLFVTCIFCILFFFSSGGSLLFIEVCWKKWSICICAGANRFMMKPKSGGVIQTITSRSPPHPQEFGQLRWLFYRGLLLLLSKLLVREPDGVWEHVNIATFMTSNTLGVMKKCKPYKSTLFMNQY